MIARGVRTEATIAVDRREIQIKICHVVVLGEWGCFTVREP